MRLDCDCICDRAIAAATVAATATATATAPVVDGINKRIVNCLLLPLAAAARYNCVCSHLELNVLRSSVFLLSY